MPITPTYPGVYIEELTSGVHTITGVATSIAAFVGYTKRGIDYRPEHIFSFSDFERLFGGLADDSELSYGVQQFFQNGGNETYVVRVPKNDNAAAIAAAIAGGDPNAIAAAKAAASTSAAITLLDKTGPGAKQSLQLNALSRGGWANQVVIDVDYYDFLNKSIYSDSNTFNLTISDLGSGAVERFRKVTMDSAKSNHVVAVVNDVDSGSKLVSAKIPDSSAGRPVATGTVGNDITALKNDKDYSLKISSDLPAGKINNVPVTIIKNGDTIPSSLLGKCQLLERQINLALSAVNGAGVRCIPSSSGKGVCVIADFASDLNAYDAILTFSPGTPNDILPDIKLDAPVSTNVGRYWLGKGRTINAQTAASPGQDGTILPNAGDLKGDPSQFTGIYALEKVDLFNILCLPDVTRSTAGNQEQSDLDLTSQNDILSTAMNYCLGRRAFLLIDARPEVSDVQSAVDWKMNDLKVNEKNGAAYFPRLKLSDSLNNSQLRSFAPCGVVAGLFARTDSNRGVWKAPAGTEATLSGVQGMVYKLTDPENGVLNQLGLNCSRTFPIYGSVMWGARTLVGADAEASEWKYVPVRRTALFLEESLYRGTQWVVFEPNDEPLWAQIRLNIGAFMHSLFRQGAFQGKTPRDAYFVKCDSETTTQDDINRGVVNIVVGFAPLKPAEFVIIQIQQMAGNIQT